MDKVLYDVVILNYGQLSDPAHKKEAIKRTHCLVEGDGFTAHITRAQSRYLIKTSHNWSLRDAGPRTQKLVDEEMIVLRCGRYWPTDRAREASYVFHTPQD
jgi:hypothetical protein